ncbi:glucose-1-phosphate adenylyltransferase [Limisphaera sp. 4302-co]|uniref:glucose-1-phosphate adenylyltransferase n=1 Tax=Limisphaera sp. 4302-co TaxID=3400417 RepID=UPI003C15E465
MAPYTSKQSYHGSNVLAVVMGGGQGTRLFPLTKYRAKPAVPLAGKYRIVDIPISNCINSGIRRIYVLTQFNSTSLHRHLSQTYKFDQFSAGFVEVLAAQQTLTDSSWYQGTADAVRKNLVHFMNHEWDYLLILSGDQLYRMDFRELIAHHVERQADITLGVVAVPKEESVHFGVLQVTEDWRIHRFVEKPKDPAVQDSLKLDPAWQARLGLTVPSEVVLASMGIYVFNRDMIRKALDNTLVDFGKEVIPAMIGQCRVFAFLHKGYWEDIGTIRAFFEANLDLTTDLPKFNFFDMTAPIFSRPRFLPASKLNSAHVDHAVVADGCIIDHSRISHSVVGMRSVISEGCELRRVVLLGCDYYESDESVRAHEQAGIPRIGIGRNTRIENAIIDKNARIGDNVVISPSGKPPNLDHELYYIRDGIVVIPKDAVIPHGTVI